MKKTYLFITLIIPFLFGCADKTSEKPQIEKEYTVTFLNYNSTFLSETRVKKGETAVYSGETPQKPSTNTLVYNFSGWDKDLTNIERNITTKAKFTQSDRLYKITFQLEDGTLVKEQLCKYNEKPICEAPIVEPTQTEVFDFLRWEPTVVKTTEDATYTAILSSATRYYSVTWLNYDYNELLEEKFQYGEKASYDGEIPFKKCDEDGFVYDFIGFDVNTDFVSEDVVAIAQYEKVKATRTIKYLNDKKEIIQISYGSEKTQFVPFEGTLPIKENTDEFEYQFDQWEIENESDNEIVFAPKYFCKTNGLELVDNAVKSYDGDFVNVTVPSCWNNVVIDEIGPAAFYNKHWVETLNLPHTISRIEKNAFNGLKKVSVFNLTDNVTYIGGAAFRSTALEEFVVPKNALLGKNDSLSGQFTGCTNLKSVIFSQESPITTLPRYTFHGCTELAEVVLPGNLESFDDSCFTYCHKLNTLTIPDNVISLNHFISHCDHFNSVVFSEKSKLTRIESGALCNLDTYMHLTIPKTVTYLGSKIVNSEWLDEIIVPRTVLEVGSNVFGISKRLVYCEYNEKPIKWPDDWSDRAIYYSETQLSGHWHYNAENKPVKW